MEINLFTAAQIAAALGKSRRAVQLRFEAILPSGHVTVKGQRTPAWSLDRLPFKLRAELIREASRRGYRDAAALLCDPPKEWHPRIPLRDVGERYAAKAQKLREAFSGTLRRMNDLSVSNAELRERGLAEYQAVFGHPISEKQWQRLLDRTATRDGGAEDWLRLEIYLDDNCAPAEPVVSVAAALAANQHPSLRQLVETFANPAMPSETEKALLWQYAFERFAELTEQGTREKTARRSLLDFLHSHTRGLAKNRHALHVAFNHKFKLWREGGCKPSALRDRRAEDARKRREVLSEDDRKTLLAYGLKFGGGLAQGWREARKAGVLRAEFTARYIDNLASKSDVPRAIKRALANDLKLLDDAMHGPRQEKLNGPHIDRDPRSICAGSWWQGDDCTLPNLYYENTSQGQRLMRGQVLVMIDLRSLYILGWVLISAPPDRPSTYSAWHIRNLITTAHDTYGLPRRGFYFENGNWRAKVLTGDTRNWDESEMGLREFGLKFIHARLPRAKPIEKLFSSFQNLCQAEPGYVGRGWHDDRYERTERNKSLVDRGHAHASENFLHRDEWMERIAHMIAGYNAESQEGKYCRGPRGEKFSPAEAYEQFFGDEKIVRLPDDLRHLLANERFAVKVGRNGVVINRQRTRGEAFIYKNAETGALWGRKVEVFFNLHAPEIIGVKNPDTGTIFAVRRSTSVGLMDAAEDTPEEFAQAKAENSEHASYRRALYRAVAPKFSEHFLTRPIFRPTLLDQATVDAGRNFTETARAETDTAKQERKLHRRASAAAAQIGRRVPLTRTSESIANAAEELAQLVEEANQSDKSQ